VAAELSLISLLFGLMGPVNHNGFSSLLAILYALTLLNWISLISPAADRLSYVELYVDLIP
jgi:hypothetical protein